MMISTKVSLKQILLPLLCCTLSTLHAIDIESSQSNWIREDQPNTAGIGLPGQPSSVIFTGSLAGGPSGDNIRGLLSFNLPATPPGHSIDSVELILTIDKNDTESTANDVFSIQLHELTTDFDAKTVTWNNASAENA
jgi:hypothetical protein